MRGVALRVGALLALVLGHAVGCFGGEPPSEERRASALWMPPNDACPIQTVSLRNEDLQCLGAVEVANDGTRLFVEVRAIGPWLVETFAIYVGRDPAPTDPALYPYLHDFTGSPVGQLTVKVPLADLEAGCGADLTLAVFATLSMTTNTGVSYDSAWAHGSPLGSPPGWSFGYEICCEALGCTRSQGYWKEHPERWALGSLLLGSRLYSAAEAMALLRTAPRGDASVNLAHQLVAAELNVAAGASLPAAVRGTIEAAQLWLARNADADGALPFGTAGRHGLAARRLADELAAYNEGLAGTMPCEPSDGLPE